MLVALRHNDAQKFIQRTLQLALFLFGTLFDIELNCLYIVVCALDLLINHVKRLLLIYCFRLYVLNFRSLLTLESSRSNDC